MEFKKIDKQVMFKEYLELMERATGNVTKEYIVRQELATKIEALIQEAIDLTGNEYIVPLCDIDTKNLKMGNWYQNNLNNLVRKGLSKYFCCHWVDIGGYKDFDGLYRMYEKNFNRFTAHFNRFMVQGNVLQFHGSVLNLDGKIRPEKIYYILQFVKTHINIDIPEWDDWKNKYYRVFTKFGGYEINNNLWIAIHLDGTLDVIFKD